MRTSILLFAPCLMQRRPTICARRHHSISRQIPFAFSFPTREALPIALVNAYHSILLDFPTIHSLAISSTASPYCSAPGRDHSSV
jgi:hypothetical protein